MATTTHGDSRLPPVALPRATCPTCKRLMAYSGRGFWFHRNPATGLVCASAHRRTRPRSQRELLAAQFPLTTAEREAVNAAALGLWQRATADVPGGSDTFIPQLIDAVRRTPEFRASPNLERLVATTQDGDYRVAEARIRAVLRTAFSRTR